MLSKGLMAASTKLLILTILLEKENYGYQIIQRVKELSGGKLDWADGMLYPVLHRLEKEKLITSRWMISEEGRNRKYYSITMVGQQELKKEKKDWLDVHYILLQAWEVNLG